MIALVRGGQIISHHIVMFKQVVKSAIKYSLILTLIFSLNNLNNLNKIKNVFNYNEIKETTYYVKALYYVKNNNENKKITITDRDGKKRTMISKDIIINKTIIESYSNALKNIKEIINTLLNYFIISLILIITIFTLKGYLINRSKYIRGANLVKPRVLNSIIKNYNKKNYNKKQSMIYSLINYYFFSKPITYKIANLIYPIGTETIHTIITGASGSGKTVLINDLLNQIRKNGDRAIVYDRMGSFVNKFYNGNEITNLLERVKNDNNITPHRKQELYAYYKNKKDIILNPLDRRTPYWSIFNEVRDKNDFDSIGAALIPESAGNIDPFWNQAARILFSSVAGKLKELGQDNNKDLLDNLLTVNLSNAAKLVVDTPAQSIIDENNPKTALSVMSMISANLKSLTTLREQKAKNEESFSIRNWIQNAQQQGFLFISSRADRHETLKPLISTWLDICINSLLSLEQSFNRKIWIIIDEAPSLHYLPSLHTGLAESRQFGGCFVISLQTIAQLNAIYGIEKARATSGLCRNRIILNTPDKDTAAWCSDNLGKQEFEEIRENISYGSSDLKDGVNLNRQSLQKNIVLPTEIMQLPNLQCYVKFAGEFPIAKSKFNYKDWEKKAERYEEREMNSIGIDSINKNKKKVVNEEEMIMEREGEGEGMEGGDEEKENREKQKQEQREKNEAKERFKKEYKKTMKKKRALQQKQQQQQKQETFYNNRDSPINTTDIINSIEDEKEILTILDENKKEEDE
ncbi:MAG: type IV secretion system DNA-binding domain-containing protein [Rickettsiales bacterium]|jgi:type IV secretory pathway TraG/TraD family ATPase VirD4|nr:type IV secretion system DNA-binding domain-containing protein [Rickettsiales bacterium]